MSPEQSGGPKKQGSGALKWLAAGCLIALLCVGGCAVGVYYVFSGLGAELYAGALTKLQKHTVVVEKLGDPLKYGGIKKVNINNNKGTIQFPVSGPKGKGMVSVTGTKTAAGWQIDTLTVTIDGSGEVISIIETGKPRKKT